MNKSKNKTLFLTRAALIAALYVALTYVSSAFGLSSGAIQLRLSEALTILPFFTFAAVPGLTLGCFLANMLTGAIVWDVVFGTAATAIGAIITYSLRKENPLFAPIGPIAANTIIVPFIIVFAYNTGDFLPFVMATVGIGEVLSCGVLGMGLLFALRKNADKIF